MCFLEAPSLLVMLKVSRMQKTVPSWTVVFRCECVYYTFTYTFHSYLSSIPHIETRHIDSFYIRILLYIYICIYIYIYFIKWNGYRLGFSIFHTLIIKQPRSVLTTSPLSIASWAQFAPPPRSDFMNEYVWSWCLSVE